MIGGFRSFFFVWRFKVRCFVIVLFRAIIDLLSLLRSYFWFFLLLSLARITQRLRPSFDKNSTHHRDFLCYSWRARVILSQAGRARYIVIFINPAFTKMIDGKSLRSLQYSRRDTTNFAVIFIYVKQSIKKTDKWKYWFLRGGENRSTRRKNLSGARERTNNKLNSTYGVDARIRTRATLVGGRRLLSPLHRPCQFPQYQWSTDTKFFKDKRYEWRMSRYLVIKKTMKYGKYDSLLKNKRICY